MYRLDKKIHNKSTYLSELFSKVVERLGPLTDITESL